MTLCHFPYHLLGGARRIQYGSLSCLFFLMLHGFACARATQQVELRPCPEGTREVRETVVIGALGATRWCELPTGRRHGPVDTWSREGAHIISGQFERGKRDGPWILQAEAATEGALQCDFVEDRVDSTEVAPRVVQACRRRFLAPTSASPR